MIMMIMITDLHDIDDMDDVDNVADVDDVADVDVSWCFMKNLVDYDGPFFSLFQQPKKSKTCGSPTWKIINLSIPLKPCPVAL